MPFLGGIRHRIEMSSGPRSSSTPPRAWRMLKLRPSSTRHGRLSASGARGSSSNVSRACKNNREAGGRLAFPPNVVVAVKAMACELPHRQGLPLSRHSIAEIKREILRRGLVASIGETTLWRWLSQDAIQPWRHRTWIFPRDPAFEEKAGRVLDLYEGLWEGQPLHPDDCVVSADEKTSIQARRRCHKTEAPQQRRLSRIEHEYERLGAWAYLAAWDVRRAKVHGRCEATTGISPFDRLVDQVMSQPVYRSAPRVFWILDNGSSHRGAACQRRLQDRWPNLVVVHTPIHASWLNQVEIYFSVLQRKALTPNDFSSLGELEERLLHFQDHYSTIAQPFQWKFTRRDLHHLLARAGAPKAQIAA